MKSPASSFTRLARTLTTLTSSPTPTITALALVLVLVVATAPAAAQTQTPPYSGPVTVCASDGAPVPDTLQYQLGAVTSAVGVTPVVVNWASALTTFTRSALPATGCLPAATYTFTIPANMLPIGRHALRLVGTNAFGTVQGPTYTITVGVAPGPSSVVNLVPGDNNNQ